VVVIEAGRYEIGEPLRFDGGDGIQGHAGPNGAESPAVIYRAEPGAAGKVIVSGGRRITGWSKSEEGLWSAPVGGLRFRELFVNGRRAIRARFPNEGFLRVESAAADRRTGFTAAGADLDSVAGGLIGAELVFLHDWSTSRVRVSAYEGAVGALRLANAIGPNAPHYAIDYFESHPRYFLEDARVFLDAPGEWYLDAENSLLHYRPLPGTLPLESEIMAPVSDGLVEVRGDTATGIPVRGLCFEGLVFEHSGWAIPENGYAGMQACFYEARPEGLAKEGRIEVPAALRFERAENCRMRDCVVRHIGGSGVWIGSRCMGNALENCVIEDVSGNGIMIGETGSRVFDGRPWWQSVPEQVAMDNRIMNCRVRRCGEQFFGAVGIWVGLVKGTVMEGNEISELPYTGVSLGWMWNPTPSPCGGNRVVRNHIHHLMGKLSDGGGIYTLGSQPGTILRDNVIHDIPLNAGRAESNGMFLDEGTTGILIEGNVIYALDRSPLRFHQAGANLVRGNDLEVGPEIPPVRYNATDEALITLEENRLWNRQVESEAAAMREAAAAKLSGIPEGAR
jgi:hypothetical protein